MRAFEERLAKRAKDKQPSLIRELLKYARLDGMISLGGGYPNPDTFIFSSVSLNFKGTDKVIELKGPNLLAASQYGPSRVDPALEPLMKQWHKAKGGVDLDDGSLCVLNGSQEGLFILAYLLINEGDSIIVSEPTYPGAISAFSSFKATYHSVDLQGDGMDTDGLATLLQNLKKEGNALPKFIYTIPNGHNPGGVTMSLAKRKRLLEIAKEHDLLVIEDDPYELISYVDEKITTLQELDTEGRVIRLDSFSKIFVPGFRVGYVTGRPEVVRQFELFKQSSNLHTSTFNQRILAAYLAEEGPKALLAHIKRSCAMYDTHRSAIIAAAREELPKEVEFEEPKSGLFIWFRLPEQLDSGKMHERFTESHKVLLVPGYGFSTKGGCRNCMRASFSTVPPEKLKEGITRFAKMIEDFGK